MARKSRLLPVVSLVLCVAAAAWLYATPYVSVRKLQSAVQDGDTDAMSALVDFPALRESVKDNLQGSVERRVSSRGGKALGALGAALTGAATNRVVDAAVTPYGLAALMEGRRPGRESHAQREEKKSAWREKVKIDRGYEGANRFAVRYLDRESGEERMALLLHRDGLAWKLAEIRFDQPDR